MSIQENTLITNGFYFTPDIVELLAEVKIMTVQITLDAFKEVHDVRRPLVNGKGTFDTIIKNLDSYFNGNGTIEFRGFNSTLHAGKVKTAVQLSLEMCHQAKVQKSASRIVTQTDNPKYTFRTTHKARCFAILTVRSPFPNLPFATFS